MLETRTRFCFSMPASRSASSKLINFCGCLPTPLVKKHSLGMKSSPLAIVTDLPVSRGASPAAREAGLYRRCRAVKVKSEEKCGRTGGYPVRPSLHGATGIADPPHAGAAEKLLGHRNRATACQPRDRPESERLQEHLHHPRQPAARVPDELLEDLVRHFHELFHPRQPLPRQPHRLLVRRRLADARLAQHLLALPDRL